MFGFTAYFQRNNFRPHCRKPQDFQNKDVLTKDKSVSTVQNVNLLS